MDELIIRAMQRRATRAELEELEQWRGASAANERRFRELKAAWSLMGKRREIDRERDVPGADRLLRARGRVRRDPPAPGLRRRRSALAAAAVIVLGLALGYFTTSRDGAGASEEAGPPAVQQFHTGPNELRTAVLADGSVARMAPNTTLRVDMGGEQRDVRLDGRAFFAVTGDPERPFAVRTPRGEAHVLGTRFEVDTQRNSLRLLVLDGRVSVTAGGGATELGAGEMGRTSGDDPLSVSRVETPEMLLDWMGAWVAFESTPLERVAVELEARLGIRIEIVDPQLAERTITGWFAEQDQEDMIALICRVADLSCTPQQGGRLIRIEE